MSQPPQHSPQQQQLSRPQPPLQPQHSQEFQPQQQQQQQPMQSPQLGPQQPQQQTAVNETIAEVARWDWPSGRERWGGARPPVPRGYSAYAQGKKAEYARDLPKALRLYQQAMAEGDRADSALKDIAGVLHQLGRTKDAIAFLTSHAAEYVEDWRGYRNLLQTLREQMQPRASNLNRTVEVALGEGNAITRMDKTALPNIFPNFVKVVRVVLRGSSARSAFVEFATHSAARKAIDVTAPRPDIICKWAVPEAAPSSPMPLHAELPIFESIPEECTHNFHNSLDHFLYIFGFW